MKNETQKLDRRINSANLRIAVLARAISEQQRHGQIHPELLEDVEKIMNGDYP